MIGARRLLVMRPQYVSVTFGAGGSTRDGTIETVRTMRELGCDATPHLACIGSSRQELRALLHRYRDDGVRRIVALRGDLPSGMGLDAAGALRHACDLVEFIRVETGDWFHIEVAAYPEMHPQAAGPSQDLAHFVRKVQAVDIPIVPGIMPITNYSQLMRFSDMCGAEIPRWIRLRLAEMGDDRESIRAFGTEVVTELCQTLLDNDVPGLHFYTLNNADATLAIWQGLTA